MNLYILCTYFWCVYCMFLKCNFKCQSPGSLQLLFRPKGWRSILTTCCLEYTCIEPQNRPKSWHFDRIIKQDIILVKTCLYKIIHKCLWRITNFIQFFMNDKLVIAVLCFGSLICNQAVRIRVKVGGKCREDAFYWMYLLMDGKNILKPILSCILCFLLWL